MNKDLQNKVLTLLNNNNFSDALYMLNSFEKTHSEDAVFWEMLALTYGMSGNNEACKNACLHAIEINPQNIGTYINLGVAQQNLGFFDATEKTLSIALSMDSNHPQVNNNLGALYILQSEYHKARPYIEKALSLQPDYSDAYSNMAEINKNQQENEKAITNYKKSLELNANNINAYLGLGSLYTYSSDYDEAELNLKHALQLNPHHSEALFNLGFMHYQLKSYVKAAEYFKATIQVNPEHHNAVYLLSAITENATPDQSPEPFVKDLFNHYAENFDSHLVKDLQYQIPGLMHSTYEEYVTPSETKNLLDLGCGTGISGEKFRTQFNHLVGIDLAENMLEKAKEKNIYDELHNQDIARYLENDTALHDLIIASDVFIYIGKIKELIKSIYKRQNDNGYFVFSIEKSFNHDTFHLRKTGRYSHSVDYIESILNDASYTIVASVPTVIRKEKGSDIEGVVYLSQKQS